MRIKTLVVSLIVTFALIGAACAAPERANVPPEYVAAYLPDTSDIDQPEVTMAVPLPETPDKAIVYKIKYPSISGRDAAGLAEKFEVSGNVTEGDELFTVTDSETGDSVEVFKTGAICFEMNSEDYLDVLFSDNAELPSLEEAQDIAITYLEERGLLPPDVKNSVRVGIGGGTTARHNTHILVSFKYQIGDYQVEGPGFRYYVRVGDKGRVGEVFLFHPDVEPCGQVELRTPQEALNDVIAGNASWMDIRGESAVIDKVSLRYYLLPVIDKQQYVLPVFVFEGSGARADGSVTGRAVALSTAVRAQSGQSVR